MKAKLPARFESVYKWARPVELADRILTLEIPNGYPKDLASRDITVLEESIYQATDGTQYKVEIRVAKAAENGHSPVPPAVEVASPTAPLVRQDIATGFPNPKYTFESFVAGKHGQFAYAAAQAVADNPGRAYNPLFIYGATGLGKTHLMHAIGHKLLSTNPRAKVCYVPSEKFTNEVINGIRTETMNDLRSRYRSIDLLLIDDIQFIEGKAATQEEFFHTFNTLHEAGKQVVIASDRPPKDLAHLEARLRTRFEWGLLTDIQAPDLETRIAILRKKADLDNLAIPDEVVEFIAGAFHDSVRELEGAFIKVMAFTSLNGLTPTLEIAQQLLGTNVRAATKERIRTVVARHYGVTEEDLRSPKRNKEFTLPRHVACYLIREMTGASFQLIGRFFDRDHTSIMHGINKIRDEVQTDTHLAATILQLKNKIQSPPSADD
ncbi:MAG: chromosomal replication initiator protein DnaA [Candidatus Sericytochromatia bacterium]|nr:chromosomal replication initiator protein DnaA [Candidatus Tanganyikabacteria bacterium]